MNAEDAKKVGEEIGINWESVAFTPEALAHGINVEMEHGLQDIETNITDDDTHDTAKIAWTHLKESIDYYNYLAEMEENFTASEDIREARKLL